MIEPYNNSIINESLVVGGSFLLVLIVLMTAWHMLYRLFGVIINQIIIYELIAGTLVYMLGNNVGKEFIFLIIVVVPVIHISSNILVWLLKKLPNKKNDGWS